MYSIKPGRGPSAFGVVGAVIVGICGIYFAASAASMGAPVFFVLFGIVFALCAVGMGIVNLYNTVSPNRFSSEDIVYSPEEPDPIDQAIGGRPNSMIDTATGDQKRFCPFCGSPTSAEFNFCPKCGKPRTPSL